METTLNKKKGTSPRERASALLHRLKAWKQNFQLFCWNSGYRLGGSNDGIPIPSDRLIRLVAPAGEVSWFLRGGKIGQECALYVLRRNNLDPERFEAILDFGCGCGRIMRHWKYLKGPRLYGTDYNPVLIRWCRQNLGDFAEFNINQLVPPLDYPDGKFDFIYVFSVFTHLTEDLQREWVDELHRVLKVGGLLLITVHGQSRLNRLTPEEQRLFKSGQMIVKYESAAGTNLCGAYHPGNYVRNTLAKSFEVVDFIDAGARDLNQDIYLLKKSLV